LERLLKDLEKTSKRLLQALPKAFERPLKALRLLEGLLKAFETPSKGL
jgi:hypothetical protein